MPLSEYIKPVLAAGGPVALLFVALRIGPDAFLRLLAGTVAVLTRDKERGERCLKVLRILRNRDDNDPPESSQPAEVPSCNDAMSSATKRLPAPLGKDHLGGIYFSAHPFCGAVTVMVSLSLLTDCAERPPMGATRELADRTSVGTCATSLAKPYGFAGWRRE